MKRIKVPIPIFLLLFCFSSCMEKTVDSRVVDKYLESFNSSFYRLSKNINAQKDSLVLYQIGSIINELSENSTISKELKNEIIQGVRSSPKVNNDRFKFLESKILNFSKNTVLTVDDLHFIDIFIQAKEFEYLDYGFNSNFSVFIDVDSLNLFENTAYRFRLKSESDNVNNIIITTDSLKGSMPNEIKLKTKGAFNERQTVVFEYEGMNRVTGEAMSFKDSLMINLLETN